MPVHVPKLSSLTSIYLRAPTKCILPTTYFSTLFHRCSMNQEEHDACVFLIIDTCVEPTCMLCRQKASSLSVCVRFSLLCVCVLTFIFLLPKMLRCRDKAMDVCRPFLV